MPMESDDCSGLAPYSILPRAEVNGGKGEDQLRRHLPIHLKIGAVPPAGKR